MGAVGSDTTELSIFKQMSSFVWRVGRSQENVNRIRRIIAHEQLSASAMALDGKRSGVQRLRFWATQVSHLGWPDGMPRHG